MNNKPLDTYLNLCTQVYDLSKPKAPEEDYTFYRNYIINTKSPVLEPMCGTGRFLLPMLEEGFDIHGFDASAHMLEALHAKANAKHLKPKVWQGFIEDLNRSEKYNLIFIPSGSFGLITDLIAAKSALKILYDHLNKDGILIFEGETLKAVPPLDIWKGSIWHKPDGSRILLSSLSTLDGNICLSIGKYELVSNNRIIHTEIEELKVRLYEPTSLIDMLQEVGFRDIRMIKAFDETIPPDINNDEVIIYECKK